MEKIKTEKDLDKLMQEEYKILILNERNSKKRKRIFHFLWVISFTVGLGLSIFGLWSWALLTFLVSAFFASLMLSESSFLVGIAEGRLQMSITNFRNNLEKEKENE